MHVILLDGLSVLFAIFFCFHFMFHFQLSSPTPHLSYVCYHNQAAHTVIMYAVNTVTATIAFFLTIIRIICVYSFFLPR